jgi:hypothetical protein
MTHGHHRADSELAEQAVTGVMGQNLRKSVTHTWADVQAEVCDVILTNPGAPRWVRHGRGSARSEAGYDALSRARVLTRWRARRTRSGLPGVASLQVL